MSASVSPPSRAPEAWGGLAGMLVALPGAIAYGVVIFSPLGPAAAPQGALAGAIGAVVLGLVAALAGSTPRLVSAPCAPAAALLAAVVIQWLGADGVAPAEVPVLLGVVALLAGLLQIGFGAVGGGRLIKYIPYPVVAGYLSAAGALVLAKQLPPLVGAAGGSLAAVWQGPSAWSGPALAVGASTVAATAVASRLGSKVPPTIVGIGAGCLAFAALALRDPTLAGLDGNPLVLGMLPRPGAALASALERARAAGAMSPGHLGLAVAPAVTLALLLSIDTLKTCVLADSLTRTRHDSNRELRAQGLANAAAALAGGAPGSGVSGATLVNLASGGTTRLSSLAAGAFALAALLVLGPVLAWMPVAALAGALAVVALRMVDWDSLRLWRHRSTVLDGAVVAGVVVVALSWNLMAAATAGVGLSILLFLRDQVRSSVVHRRALGDQRRSRTRRLPSELEALRRDGSAIAIYELQGSLFFGTADQLLAELEPHLAVRDAVVLDLRRVLSIDLTAARMLSQAAAGLAAHGGVLAVSGARQSPAGARLDEVLGKIGLRGATAAVRRFDDLDTALAWAEERVLARGHGPRGEEAPLALAGMEVLAGLDPADQEALARVARPGHHPAGTTLFRRGQGGDEMFFVRSGRVRIDVALERGGALHVATFQRGDFFGDLAFLDAQARSADAVAETDVEVYALSRRALDEAAAARPALGARLFEGLGRALAARLRATDEEIRALQEE